jgi:uncharacterized RDD family membrane protein YckC
MPCTQHPAVNDNLDACSVCGKSFCPDCLVKIKSNPFCAACKVEAVKDLQSGLSGTSLHLASLGQRVGAALLDWLLQAAGWFLLFIPLIIAAARSGPSKPGSGEKNQFVFAILQLGIQLVGFAGTFLYEGLFLQFKGATPGKLAVGLRVVTETGDRLPSGQAWIRTLVKVLANICGATYIVAFFRNDRCTLHDLAARTRVIRVQ